MLPEAYMNLMFKVEKKKRTTNNYWFLIKYLVVLKINIEKKNKNLLVSNGNRNKIATFLMNPLSNLIHLQANIAFDSLLMDRKRSTSMCAFAFTFFPFDSQPETQVSA